MPIFSYSFIQKKDRLYSYLKRKNEGQPFFDLVMFNESEYLILSDTDIWRKWREETCFCDSIDLVDFVFILQADADFFIPKNGVYFKTSWSNDDIKKLINDIMNNACISGSIDNDFSIGGVLYKVIRYTSKTLPNNVEQSKQNV